MMDIHASGHGHREDLRQMIRLIRPKFLMPIHGHYSMMVNHGYLAQEEGIPEENIIIADNGSIVHITADEWWFDKKTAPADSIMVDGLGIGDIGNVVLRDRQVLAEYGMFVIVTLIDSKTGTVRGSPDIISRGFVYLKENKELLAQVRKKVKFIVEKKTTRPINWSYLKDLIRDEIGMFLFQKTERRPMVLPVVIEV
jgi:ribonuclease J